MQSKIFLESANPLETQDFVTLLGALDGQLIHPGALAVNPEIQKRIQEKGTFDRGTFTGYYNDVVEQIAQVIPEGTLITSVYINSDTTADDLIDEGKEVALWTSKVHAQLPASLAGIEAASMLTQAGFRVAVNHVYTQQQAGAVYEVTTQALAGDVFVTLDMARLCEGGCDGRSLVVNIQKMFKAGDAHVEILLSGVKDVETLVWGIMHDVDAVAASGDVLRQWVEAGKPTKLNQSQLQALEEIKDTVEYEDIDIAQEKNSYVLTNKLTDHGLESVVKDWSYLLKL